MGQPLSSIVLVIPVGFSGLFASSLTFEKIRTFSFPVRGTLRRLWMSAQLGSWVPLIISILEVGFGEFVVITIIGVPLFKAFKEKYSKLLKDF